MTHLQTHNFKPGVAAPPEGLMTCPNVSQVWAFVMMVLVIVLPLEGSKLFELWQPIPLNNEMMFLILCEQYN